MKENVVAAVVVTYNRKELLQECLEALLNQKDIDVDIIVVDNASSDGTDELMDEYITHTKDVSNNVYYIRLKENIGGSGGFYKGIKKAAELSYHYIWIMDDDTIAKEDACIELVHTARLLDDDFGYLSSTVLWTDNKSCEMNIQKFDNNISKSYKYVQKGIVPVKSATFVSLFINLKAVKMLGLPLKEYFIWGDDKEYTLRLSKEYGCYYVSKSIVIHKMQTNNGSNIVSDDKTRISRYYYAYRNDLATAKKCGWKEVVNYYIIFVKTIVRIIRSGSSSKLKRIGAMFRGMFRGIFFNPKPEYIPETETIGK